MTKHVHLNGFRHTNLGEFTADASDLGLAPGVWPVMIATTVEGKTYLTGRGEVMGEDEIIGVKYRADGATFIIWND